DPVGKKLGSGGGTTWLLHQAYLESCKESAECVSDEKGKSQTSDSMAFSPQFQEWLASEKRLLLHAGGQGRRLPAYSPSGKILMPLPVFRWERGQRLSQDLLSLQVPFYEHLLKEAPEGLHTMIVSGDVYIRATEALQPIPDVDVVCYGLWLGDEIAKDHGVFVMSRHAPSELKCMLQKPSVETLTQLLKDHLYLTDIGIWLFSDRAINLLMKRSMKDGDIVNYDMYSEFGCCLGSHPTINDEELNALKVAILPLPGGEFYHYGTSPEIISSTLAIQNLVNDQREIMHHSRKPHPLMFVLNSQTWLKITSENHHLWIENSCVSEHWKLSHHHIITGVPENMWEIELKEGQCVDIIPIGEKGYAVRPYGFEDKFRGNISQENTHFIGQPIMKWAEERQIQLGEDCDIQSAKLFPVVYDIGDVGLVLRWMLNEPYQQGGKMLWERAERLSADDISNQANLVRLFRQRNENRMMNWPFLAKNYAHSVFYQVDLENAAREFADGNIALPHPLPEDEPLLTRIHDAMFRSEVERNKGVAYQDNEEKAFSLLRQGLTSQALA
ncbi:MAG: bifunctional fucokinase/L-fucose-1-P-guanylyltransferase, partial [Prevotella sp.]|nr:bifunctional fucokinase/L-fucose-1-P-guanylyltransferase [Prevotella sp.]